MDPLCQSQWYHPTTTRVAMQVSITAVDGFASPYHLVSTGGWLQMTRSKPASALVWKLNVSCSPTPCSFRDDLSDDRPLALDGNPGDYFLANFDRQHTPVHDEGCAIFLVVDRLAFKFTA